jgi:hypothetical protein
MLACVLAATVADAGMKPPSKRQQIASESIARRSAMLRGVILS